MRSRDLEVRALRIESLKLVQQAENVLADLRAHQRRLEAFLEDLHTHQGGKADL